MRFYPQKPKDEEFYFKGLVMRCVGVPMWILKEMVNPKNKLLSECKFLPTVANLSEFIESRYSNMPVWKPFVPESEFVEDSQSVKDAAVSRWARTRAEKIVEVRKGRKPIQYHDPVALIKSLEAQEDQRVKLANSD